MIVEGFRPHNLPIRMLHFYITTIKKYYYFVYIRIFREWRLSFELRSSPAKAVRDFEFIHLFCNWCMHGCTFSISIWWFSASFLIFSKWKGGRIVRPVKVLLELISKIDTHIAYVKLCWNFNRVHAFLIKWIILIMSHLVIFR